MTVRFRVEGSICFLLALWLLTMPISWVLGAIVASIIHEAFHFLAARILAIPVREIQIGAGGMTMFLPELEDKEECIIAAAGPCGSFLCIVFLRICPQLAVCGLVQGLFNLLPVYPLDGGRVLRCVLRKRFAEVERAFLITGLVSGCVLSIWFGSLPFLVALAVTAKALHRKFPCNAANLAVQ